MITLAKPIERKGCRLPQRQRSLTAGVHRHSFGSQRSHVRAAHDRGAEIDPVARSETWVIEQRLDVAEVWVVLEVEVRQAREPAQPAQPADVAD